MQPQSAHRTDCAAPEAALRIQTRAPQCLDSSHRAVSFPNQPPGGGGGTSVAASACDRPRSPCTKRVTSSASRRCAALGAAPGAAIPACTPRDPCRFEKRRLYCGLGLSALPHFRQHGRVRHIPFSLSTFLGWKVCLGQPVLLVIANGTVAEVFGTAIVLLTRYMLAMSVNVNTQYPTLFHGFSKTSQDCRMQSVAVAESGPQVLT